MPHESDASHFFCTISKAEGNRRWSGVLYKVQIISNIGVRGWAILTTLALLIVWWVNSYTTYIYLRFQEFRVFRQSKSPRYSSLTFIQVSQVFKSSGSSSLPAIQVSRLFKSPMFPMWRKMSPNNMSSQLWWSIGSFGSVGRLVRSVLSVVWFCRFCRSFGSVVTPEGNRRIVGSMVRNSGKTAFFRPLLPKKVQ